MEKIDTKMFIDIIKGHPAIWNVICDEYKGKKGKRHGRMFAKLLKILRENKTERKLK